MKAIQGIMLLTIMLAVSCTKEPGEGVPVPPTAEENFVNAINEILVWDSDGTELTAGIDENKVGTLSFNDYVSYSFSSLKEGSTTQAIYEAPYGGGFIGVELFNDNKQAVMYKNGTVEAWASADGVRFDLEHKMESSAKGEWIATAQFKTVRIDKIGYAMMSDGNIYLIDEANPLGFLTFKHVSHPSVGARGTDDGKHRDRAIYKKADAEEYLGLLADDTEHLSVYKDAMISYWITEDAVSFDGAHKFFSFADDISGQKVWNSTGDELTAGYDKKGDGAIGHTVDTVFTPLYFYESLVTDSRTRAYYTDASGKFIGVEYDPAFVPSTEGVAKDHRALVMYKNFTTVAWDTKDAVVFDATSIVRSSSKGEWVINTKNLIVKINDVIYTMKDDGNLYTGDTLAFTYMHNYTPTPVTRTPNDGMDAYKAIYKREGAEEYLGLSSWDTKVFTVNYQKDHDRTLFWPTPGEVVFTDPNAEDDTVPYSKVPRTEEENFINNTYDKIVLDVKDKELTMAVNFTTAKSTITDDTSTELYTYDSYKGTIDGVSVKYQAIYKSTTDRYIGVEFVSPNVSMYRANGTTATEGTDWTSAGAVEFKNETTTVAGWELVGDILTANSGSGFQSCFPSITMDKDGNLYAAFRNHSASTAKTVGILKYTKGGDAWAPIVAAGGSLTTTIGSAITDMTDIVVSAGGSVFTAYIVGNNQNNEGKTGVFKYDPNNGADWVAFGDKVDDADAEFMDTGGITGGQNLRKPDPSMLINVEDGTEYIYIVTALDKNIIIKKRKTDGSDTWVQVGLAPFNENTILWASTSLVLNPKTKQPVVGISGHFQPQSKTTPASQNQTTRVAEFNGTDWIELGDSTEGASGANKGASGHSVAVNSQGVIYVGYTDGAVPYSSKYAHSVKKWTGTAWELVGKAGFTQNKGDFVKIAFYSDDTPVVTIGGSGAVQTVVKAFYFDDTSWKSLGANQVSDNDKDYYSDSVIGPDDMFYTIYSDSKTGTPLTVKSRPRVGK